VSTLLHATVYVLLHNLLTVLVQIANKIGLQKNMFSPIDARQQLAKNSLSLLGNGLVNKCYRGNEKLQGNYKNYSTSRFLRGPSRIKESRWRLVLPRTSCLSAGCYDVITKL
jgi:hypothetical protein